MLRRIIIQGFMVVARLVDEIRVVDVTEWTDGISDANVARRIMLDADATTMKTRLFKYTENFTTKNEKLPDKKICCFSYFCSKHRLWVLVRTASARRF